MTPSPSIATNFGAAAATYESHAAVQADAARRLVDALPPLPDGPILEIGCGTGQLTRLLRAKYRDRTLIATDLCPQLAIDYPLDGQSPLPPNTYALIIHNYVAQWFDNPLQTIDQQKQGLLPGGLVACTLPNSTSYSEWRQAALLADLPYTANPLPDLPTTFTFTTTHQNPLAFFRSLKAKGAHTPTNPNRLTINQLRRLCKAWVLENNLAKATYCTSLLLTAY